MRRRADSTALLVAGALLLMTLAFSGTALSVPRAANLSATAADDQRSETSACSTAYTAAATGDAGGPTELCAQTLPIRAEDFVGTVRGGGMLTRFYGTGWCLTPGCDLVMTGYHVTRGTGVHARFGGTKAGATFSATNEDDAGARVLPSIYGEKLSFKLSWVRDISVLAMRTKPKGMRGLGVYAGELKPQERVFLVGSAPGNRITHSTRLQALEARYQGEAADGILSFDVEGTLREGFSGGPILNQQGQVVGMIFGASADYRSAYAVPVWSIADFIRKIRPELHDQLFPVEPYRPTTLAAESAVDVFAIDFPEIEELGVSPGSILPVPYLQGAGTQAEVSAIPVADPLASIEKMRLSARRMSEQMKNYVAAQQLILSDGSIWQHEVRVVDGEQTFRARNDGGEKRDLPLPKGGPVPGAEWARFPSMVADSPSGKLEVAGKIMVGGQAYMIFRYAAAASDHICRLRTRKTRLFRTRDGEWDTDCQGEVWTDELFNIVRITQDMKVPVESGFEHFSMAVLYGWLPQGRLVPVKFFLRSVTTEGAVSQSLGRYTNYRVFSAESKIVVAENMP